MGVYFRPVLAEADPETSKFVFFNFLLILFGDGVTSQPGDFEAIHGPGRVLQPYGGGWWSQKTHQLLILLFFLVHAVFLQNKNKEVVTQDTEKGCCSLYLRICPDRIPKCPERHCQPMYNGTVEKWSLRGCLKVNVITLWPPWKVAPGRLWRITFLWSLPVPRPWKGWEW